MAKFPCICCEKAVKCNQRGLLCPKCSNWIHIKCANISKTSYDSLDEQFVNWQCPKYIFQQLLFYQSDIPYASHISQSKLFKFPSQKGLKLSHLNIRSLNNKKDDVELFLKNVPI